MNLNETDARAVDMLLSGIQGFPVEPAAMGAAGGTAAGTSTSAADFMQSAGVTGAVSNMSDELSSRVSHVDDILRLLDYLPADEPPASLLDRTLQRITESRLQTPVSPSPAQLNLPAMSAAPPAGFNPSIARSPDHADGDPATA